MKYFCVLILIILISFKSFGQDTTVSIRDTIVGFRISGSIDGYIRNSSVEASSLTSQILKHNAPGLGSANIALRYNQKKIGAKLHLAAGPRADQFYALDKKDILRNIREGYFYYKIRTNLKITLGTMVAYPGYENDEAYLNPNYSASYLNSSAPATYSGLAAEYTISNYFTLTFGVFNDTDRKIDVTPGKHFASMLVYKKNKLGITFSLNHGKEVERLVTTLDLILEYKLNIKNLIALEVLRTNWKFNAMKNSHYYGLNLYYMYQISDLLSLNLRSEYFSDTDGIYFGTKENDILGFTLTGKYKWWKFTFMPEIRFDKSSKDIFPSADNIKHNSDFSRIIGLTFAF